MDESNIQFATKDRLSTFRGRRRITPWDWPHVGRVHLQSARAAEFIRIDGARQRARLAAFNSLPKEHEAAMRELLLLVCYLLVLDENNQPFFTEDDKQFILDLDSAVTDPLVEAAIRHCGVEALDLEAAQKK